MDIDMRSWPVIAWIFSIVAAAGAFVLQTRQNTTKLNKIEHDVNKKLYKPDGESVFMPRSSCTNCRVLCKEMREKEISRIEQSNLQVQQDIKDMNKTINTMVGEIQRTFKDTKS